MNKAFALPVPTGHGSLEQYIHTVNNIPMLSPDEEQNLAIRQIEGDLEAAKKLILSHLRVVVSIFSPVEVYDYFHLQCTGLRQKSTSSFYVTGV